MVDTLSDVNNTDNYGAGQIQVLEGLEAVRKRPGMILVQLQKEVCIIWYGKSLIIVLTKR